MSAVVLFGILITSIIIGVPVCFGIAYSGIGFLLVTHMKPMILIAQRALNGMDSYTLLAIPLFTLAGYLMDRGATDAFDGSAADFSRMADFPWYIDDILQKAKIKTDEEGLEAAAVTMIALAEGAAMEEEEPPQYVVFHANEPFRYYIVTTQTQDPLVVFAGQEVR